MSSPAVLNPPANGAADFASQYDIHDPVHELAEEAVTAAAARATPAKPAPTTTPAPAPAAQPAGSSPAAPQSPAPSAPVQKHSARVLAHATNLGIHPLVIERLSADELSDYVLDELSKVRQSNATASVAAAIQTPPPAAAVSPPPPPPSFWGVHDDIDPLTGAPTKREIQDQDLHPALVAQIKAQDARIKQLETFIQSNVQAANLTADQQRQKAFDDACSKVGGLLGVGTAQQLKGKPEFDRRSTLYAAVKGMYTSLPPELRDQMPLEKAVASMAKSLFGIEPAAAATQPNGPTPQQFRQAAVGTPTQRRGNDQPLGRDTAIEAANAWWKENAAGGGIPESGNTSMDEFLPIG